MANKNSNLHQAKSAKNDEFYTQLTDIEKEMMYYKDFFKGKIVLCNCNDMVHTNFAKYFSLNFEHLGLKKLICTAYKIDGVHGKVCIYEGDKNGNLVPDIEEWEQHMLNGDGSFDSGECIELLKKCDVVVTNPPFSCYSDDTEVMTNKGWKLFKDVNIEKDLILSLNPNTKEMEYVKAVDYYCNRYDGVMYNFKSRNVDLFVTPNHRMYAVDSNNKVLYDKENKLIMASDVKKTHLLPRDGFSFKGIRQNYFILPQTTQKEQYSRKEITIPEKSIPMGDWLEFFGFYLADGCFRDHINSKNGNRDYTISVKQHRKNEEYVLNLFERIGFKANISIDGDKANYWVHSKQLWTYLKQFGRSYEKYIPNDFLKLDKEYLERLLKGYSNGDSYQNEKEIHYSSVSKKLILNIQEILLKIYGHLFQIREVKSKYKGEPYIYFMISRTKNIIHSFNTKYGVPQKKEYHSNVYCLQLEKNHIMLVKRNGIVSWCGNCFRSFAKTLFDYDKKFLIMSNNNAITYKEFFPFFKEKKVWLGRTLFTGKMPYFKVSDDYPMDNERFIKKEDGLYKQVNAICWFTNIPNDSNRESLCMFKKYTPEEYPQYDNYNAIECGRMENLPYNYNGIIGIPITGLKYLWSDGTIHTEDNNGEPTQFEIVGIMSGAKGEPFTNGNDNRPKFYVNNKGVYARILIKRIV